MLNKIISILKVNNVEYDINLKNLDQDIKNDLLEYKDNILEELYSKLPYYINNGFDKKAHRTLAELSELLYKLTLDNKPRVLSNIKNSIAAKLEELKDDQDAEYKIFDELDGLLYFTIEGAKSIYELHNIEFTKKFISLMENVRTELGKVVDKTSVSAANYQKQVYEAVYKLGNQIASYFYEEGQVLKEIDNINSIISKWQGLVKCDSSKKKREAFDVSSSVMNGLQKAYANRDFISELKALQNKLNMDTKLLERYNSKEDELKLIELQEQINNYNRNLVKLAEEYKNGRITGNQFINDSNRTKNFLHTTKQRELVLSQRVIKNKQIYDSRTASIDNLKFIIEELDLIKSEIYDFYAITEELDLKNVANILNGTLTDSEENKAFNQLDEILKRINHRIDTAVNDNSKLRELLNRNIYEQPAYDPIEIQEKDNQNEIDQLLKEAELIKEKTFATKTGITKTEEVVEDPEKQTVDPSPIDELA